MRAMPDPTIVPNVLEALAGVPAHSDDLEVVRWFARGSAAYVAVHELINVPNGVRQYCEEHSHQVEDEINVLVGRPGELTYRIRLDDDSREVDSPATVFIPAGVTHSANVLSGSGYLVVIRIPCAGISGVQVGTADV